MKKSWGEWRKHAKWWLRYRLLGNPWRAMKDVYWWIAHRTWRRFDVVKLKFLEPGYYDTDTMMIHAMFTLLVDYVEKEKPGLTINWEITPEHSHAWKEIQDLYRWWKFSYLKRREPILDVPDGHSRMDDPVWVEACQQTHELEKRWAEEDMENSIRLVKIRGYLWT